MNNVCMLKLCSKFVIKPLQVFIINVLRTIQSNDVPVHKEMANNCEKALPDISTANLW